ncbi:MAG: hypothetical protein KKB51_15780, partial [Candidatus Riflebacteria bacterium]|nr:hypothetical protein [Candidatus Riflebacteria bacterium]
MSFDNAFKSDAKYYGPSMSSIITSFLDQVNPVFPILDIGAGQGRNTIPLAKLGFRLHAVEPSNEGAQAIQFASTE